MGMTETAMSSPRFPVSSQQRNDQNSGFGLSYVAPTPCSIASSISISVISLSTQIGLSWGLWMWNVEDISTWNVKAEKVLLPNLEIQTRSFNLVGAQVSPMNEL